ncbi:MAG TPA: hypothetical protein PLB89_03955 [Flavobacteriales bacterium]|nr:hypothetical protein [Flavobacteriales bacterium]
MNIRYILPVALVALAPVSEVPAQCAAGELEVTIDVTTDDFGNETLWQLVETGNACDESPIFIGGQTDYDCSDAGTDLSPDGGYPNNTTITEGPFCLTEGGTYDIISIDLYGDAQASFTVLVDGGYIGAFSGDGGMTTHTFTVVIPFARDLALTESTTGFFCEAGSPVTVAGTVQNFGGSAVTSFDIAYTIDGGAEQTSTITGINLAPGATRDFVHEVQWSPAAAGTNVLEMHVASVNGDTDLNPTNDSQSSDMIVNPAIPDRMDDFLATTPVLTIVADADQDLLVPRDLDFHPDRSRNELWVINKDVPSTGGSTVMFTAPGEPDMDFLQQRDINARHFMSLPTGIAFGDNGNFSTSPGIWDANQNQATTTPFTGITLWSSDPAIYAMNLFGPLGSHLDMLHVTPKAQGLAHERWNRYWVVDGHNQDVVMHDFRADHGPGNDYHGNAIIHRYPEVSITRDPGDHIVSHCVLDKHTNWLYVVDHGGQRILRLDTRSGSIAPGSPDFGPFESYVEYEDMEGATVEVLITTGLQEPAGIDLVGNHLLVSDHATGEIIIYDMSNAFAEQGRISTGAPGIMGIEVGPDGRIWYVNATTNALGVVEPASGVGLAETATSGFRLHPNPSSNVLYLTVPAGLAANTGVQVIDATGRISLNSNVTMVLHGLDVSGLANGSYSMVVAGYPQQRFVIAR